MNNDALIHYALTPSLNLAYEAHGPAAGDPVIGPRV